MRWSLLILTLSVAMLLPATQVLAGKKVAAAAGATVTGTVVGLKEKGTVRAIVITAMDENGQTQEKTIKVNGKTAATLNGNPIKLTALLAGMKVQVTLNSHNVATTINAASK